MALISLVSAGGAPGVTTTAVALTLTWPGTVLLAECDMTGASVLPGLFNGHIAADRGILHLALAVAENPALAQAALREQTVALDEAGERPLLPGPVDPFQARAIDAAAWEDIATLLAAQQGEVIADVGQVLADERYPVGLLAAADMIVMVMRPTVRQIAAAQPRLAQLRQALGESARFALCLIGRGAYSAGEIRKALGPFAATVLLPDDPRSARRLSDGDATGRRDLRTSELLVQARPAARTLREALLGQTPDWLTAEARTAKGGIG